MSRAEELIRDLRLQPHPEGGHFREIFRSGTNVAPDDGRTTRSALTLIYYLLENGGHSRWHRVRSDETWQHVEGATLELLRMDPALQELERLPLGALTGGQEPVGVIPRDYWQAARTTGEYTLVTCAVGPGFDFADFAMLSDYPDEVERVRGRFPDAARYI